MEISVLKEFVVLVQTHSFQRTSERMHLSQSSLTKHIHKLEQELNVPLFNRSTRRVSTTEYGQNFYKYTKQIVDIFNTSVESLNDLNTNNMTSFSINFLPMLSHYGIAEMTSNFVKNNPNYQLNLEESNNPERVLLDGQCDFAFITDNSLIGQKMNSLIYQTDSLVAVLAEEHPLAKNDSLSLKELKDQKFITHKIISGRSNLKESNFYLLCNQNGFVPKIVANISFSSTILKLVRQNYGVAILNRKSIPPEATDVKIINIVPKIPFYVYMIYLKEKKLNKAANDFLNYVNNGTMEK